MRNCPEWPEGGDRQARPLDSSQPETVGDTGVTIRAGGESPSEKMARVRELAAIIAAAGIDGVLDVVQSSGRVTVFYAPSGLPGIDALLATLAAAVSASPSHQAADGTLHEIPVTYDGPDLGEICAAHGIEKKDLIAGHSEPDYVVEAIGFLPGFGYLAGLPATLATPRRPTPRRLVPAGAVGIGGGQTGLYPFASPGGWNLVGRSDAVLFDPTRPRPALFAVGDRVRFVPADLPPPDTGAGAAPAQTLSHRAITVLEPGLFTTVQDLGRPGYRASGVPLSGAADPVSVRLANLLVGNPENAAGLECTLLGPTLRFDRDAVVALVGACFPGLDSDVAVQVSAGQVVTLGHAVRGCRGYLAVAGGIDVKPVLGSRSTLVAARLGGVAGRPLVKGDGLAAGEPQGTPRPGASLGGFEWRRPRQTRPCELRVIPGEHAAAFGPAAWTRVDRVTSRADRMGVRFEGLPLPSPVSAVGMASVAVFPGTVQVPPDGQPILLLADAQTIGGYPILAHVIAADLPLAAQLRPGDTVTWRPVSIAEAHAAIQDRDAAVAAVREEWR